MNLNIKDKKVLVTGSSRGIGLSIVQSFIKEGCSVVANGRNQEDLLKAINNLKCHGIAADVSDPNESKRLVDEAIDCMGGIDVLICNIGNSESVKPGEENYDEWQQSLKSNFFTASNMIEASKHDLEKNNGSIVCISSICGLKTIDGAPITYSVSKAALNAYIKNIAPYMAKNGVRVNGVAPGNIFFEGSVWDKKLKEKPEVVQEILANNVPMNKLGKPEDVSSIVLWLSSPLANFVTGSIYVVDGGQTCL